MRDMYAGFAFVPKLGVGTRRVGGWHVRGGMCGVGAWSMWNVVGGELYPALPLHPSTCMKRLARSTTNSHVVFACTEAFRFSDPKRERSPKKSPAPIWQQAAHITQRASHGECAMASAPWRVHHGECIMGSAS